MRFLMHAQYVTPTLENDRCRNARTRKYCFFKQKWGNLPTLIHDRRSLPPTTPPPPPPPPLILMISDAKLYSVITSPAIFCDAGKPRMNTHGAGRGTTRTRSRRRVLSTKLHKCILPTVSRKHWRNCFGSVDLFSPGGSPIKLLRSETPQLVCSQIHRRVCSLFLYCRRARAFPVCSSM